MKFDRRGFEDVHGKNEYDKYEQIKTLQKSLNACEAKYLKEFQEMSDELSRREQIHVETKDKLTAVEEELKIFKEELKVKEREYSTNITKYQKKFKQVNQILTKLLKNYAVREKSRQFHIKENFRV